MVLGVILVLGIEELSNKQTGMILAFGGGIYAHVGAAECMSKSYHEANTMSLRILSLVGFVVGAIAIGLVLLDHEHCVPGGGGGGHEGHGHR